VISVDKEGKHIQLKKWPAGIRLKIPLKTSHAMFRP
jgi:hypothetical protein